MSVYIIALDDSGTHVGSPLAVVGGVILSEQNFVDLEAKWRTTLAKYGINIFHSADCDAGKGEFRDWTIEKRRLLSLELANIFSSHVTEIMAFGVSPRDFSFVWEKLNLASIGIKQDVYRILLELCFHQIGDWARRLSSHDIVKIFVEKGNKKASFVNDLYCRVNEDQIASTILNINEIIFREKDFLPLQAADLLVHKIHRFPRLKPGFLPLQTCGLTCIRYVAWLAANSRCAHSSTAKAVVFCLRPHKYHPNLGTDNMEDVLRVLTNNSHPKAIKLWHSEELEQVLSVRKNGDQFFIKKKKK